MEKTRSVLEEQKKYFLLWLLLLNTFLCFSQFGPQNTITDDLGESIRYVTITDIDGDGDQDVIAAVYPGGFAGSILWYPNLDGEGDFGAPILIDDFTGAGWVEAADLDGDGHQDLMVSSVNTQTAIRVYFNLGGDASFPEETFASVGTFAVPADIDNDGDLDLVGPSGEFARNVDGLGDFEEENFTESVVKTVCVGDFDGDSDQDIAFSRSNSNIDSVYLYWVPNLDGEGTFGDQILIEARFSFQAAFSFGALQAADLDNDGLDDIITGDGQNREVAVYFAEQGGNFSDRLLIHEDAPYPTAIRVRDLDNDGDQDIAYATINAHASWSLNEGNRNFAEPEDLQLTLNGCRAISLGDISGDGHFDIATSCYTNSLTTLLSWNENFFNKTRIEGYVFLDENENGIYDVDEVAIDQPVGLLPDYLWSGSSEFGKYQFIANPGTYELECTPDENWTGTNALTRSISVQDEQATLREDFGLIPNGEVSDLQVNVASAPTRCGFTVTFWLDVKNTGNQFERGYVSLDLDDRTTLLAASPAPDFTSNSTLRWNFEDLAPTHSRQIELHLQMPGVESLGDYLDFQATATAINESGAEMDLDQFIYAPQVNCAYDPNDKLVLPFSEEVGNPTPLGSTLDYTVRFQNTGTDTAFTVRIEDQLDNNLDWSTFRPLAASHSYTASLDDAGKITFLFSNILLPDSTTNEPASHGFIQFEIDPVSDISEGTQIFNSADIYFDFNPPIITNSTVNTMEMISGQQRIPSDFGITVYPNPSSGRVTIEVDQAISGDLELELYDCFGRALKRYSPQQYDRFNLSLEHLPAGLYVLKFSQGQRYAVERIVLK